uniref:Uncharacterized protein n=1 Tax=Rhizophora mucronata TaxID=61149 RepID=A0A2P2JW02_RHIMU
MDTLECNQILTFNFLLRITNLVISFPLSLPYSDPFTIFKFIRVLTLCTVFSKNCIPTWISYCFLGRNA